MPDHVLRLENFVHAVAVLFDMPMITASVFPERLLKRVEERLTELEGSQVPTTDVDGDPLDRLDGTVEALRRLSGAPRWLGLDGALAGLTRRYDIARGIIRHDEDAAAPGRDRPSRVVSRRDR